MRDRLGVSAWVNRPLANPIQSPFRRFLRMPGAGLPDLLEGSRLRFQNTTNDLMRTRFSDMMRENGEHDA